jgi:hypothetical protein
MSAGRLDASPVLAWLAGSSDHVIAERVGVAATAVARWRRGAHLRVWTADRVATRLDLHPANLWGDDWWTA